MTRSIPLAAAATLTSALTSALTFAQNQTQFRWFDSCPSGTTCISNVEVPGLSYFRSAAILPADYDRDGDLDILSVGSNTDLLRNEMILGGTPSYGVYTAPGLTNTVINDASDGDIADFDGDGDFDLVISSTGGTSFCFFVNTTLGAQSSNFIIDDGAIAGWNNDPIPNTNTVITGDFDGDGDPDALFGGPNGLRLFQNDPISSGPARNFTDISTGIVSGYPGGNVQVVEAADVNGDGAIDMIVGGGVYGVISERYIGFNQGAGQPFNFVALPAPTANRDGLPLAIEAADIDGDDDIDLVFGHQARQNSIGVYIEGSVVVYENVNSMGAMLLTQGFGAVRSYTGVAVGDVDGDGIVEILASSKEEAAGIPAVVLDGRTCLFARPVGGGQFVEQSMARVDDDTTLPSGLPSRGGAIALADLDIDGDLDIMVGHVQSTVPGMFFNMHRQLDAPRDLQRTVLPNQDEQWDFSYELTAEVGSPLFDPISNPSFAVLGATVTPPQHLVPMGLPGEPAILNLRPAGSLGANFLTNYSVTGILDFTDGTYTYDFPTIGPFPPASASMLIGLEVYAQSIFFSRATSEISYSGIVMSTLR